MRENVLIKAETLTKNYDGRPVVSNVTFTLHPGEILALLGPNGAGKTTTIKMILGLVMPTSGTVRVNGYNMAKEKEMRHGARHIGAVLEGTRNAYWRLSAFENLRYFGGLRGLSRKFIDERADELLSMLDLLEHRDIEVRKFSRGMQQKVAIANALMHDPEILILDEPTLGLDVEAARLLEDTILRLSKRGKAILLTTHTMNLAEKLANRIFVIHEGQKVAHEETQTLLQKFDTRIIVEIKTQEPIAPHLWDQISRQFPSLIKQGKALEWVEPEQRQIVSLYQMLNDADYTVLSVTRREPKLEEVFLSLIRKTKSDGPRI